MINLVTEQTLEHRMITLLAQKQELADGVLDGRGDLSAINLPSGRAAFLERLQSLMAEPPRERDLAETICASLLEQQGDGLLLVQARRDAAGIEGLLVVVETEAEAARRALGERIEAICPAGQAPPQVEVLDRATWDTIARLVESGNLQFAGQARELLRTGGLDRRETDQWREQRRQARELLDQADRNRRMAALLVNGGFAEEASEPLGRAEALAQQATAVLDGDDEAAAAVANSGAAMDLTPDELSRGLAMSARTIELAQARLASGEVRAVAPTLSLAS